MDFRAKLVSWAEIEKWCETINKKMLADFQPDVIIGLSRGGLVPARILSDMNLIKDLYAIKTEHWGLTATVDGKAVLKYGLSVPVEGKKVIVVDDITDTGQSMKLAYDYALSQKPAELKTATMLHITHSTYEPDYYGEKVDEAHWTWFIFPWNVYEDVTNLAGKLKFNSAGVDKIREMLNEHYMMKIDDLTLEKVLKQMKTMNKIKENGEKYSSL